MILENVLSLSSANTLSKQGGNGMKKWLSLLLAFLLTFTLAGCTAEEQELAGAVLDIVLEEVLEETDAPEEAEQSKAEPQKQNAGIINYNRHISV